MNTKDLDEAVPKIARNELFYFIARASMLAASLIGLPVAGYMMSRIIAQSDALQSVVAQQNVEFKVLSATIKERLESSVAQLSDHELRIRTLERQQPKL